SLCRQTRGEGCSLGCLFGSRSRLRMALGTRVLDVMPRLLQLVAMVYATVLLFKFRRTRKSPAKKSLVLCWMLYVAGNVVEFWTDWATYGGSDVRTDASGLALGCFLILLFAWWKYYPRS